MDVTKPNLPAIRQRVGLVFQDSDAQLFMPTVIEDVMFGPLNQGLSQAEAQRRALLALEQTGIPKLAAKAPYHLSSGREAPRRPRRHSCDGPGSISPRRADHVPRSSRPARLTRLIKSPAASKAHRDPRHPFARALATRAVFFDSGRVAAEGTVEEIIHRFDWEFR